MREIKFRAWDKKEKKIFNVGCINFLDGIVYTNNNFLYSWQNSGIEIKNIKLMQFTGLLDKNGKEIYEGDILKYYEEVDGVVKWFDNLIYDSGGALPYPGFYCEEWLVFEEIDHYYGFNDVKVIGNIYENPELVKNN